MHSARACSQPLQVAVLLRDHAVLIPAGATASPFLTRPARRCASPLPLPPPSNYVKYLVGDISAADCHAPFGPVKGQMWDGLCLNMSRWDAIHRFTRESGLGLIFGLGYPNPEAWDPANAMALLEYTSRKNYSLYGVELGEEMAPRPGTAAFKHVVAAYATLRKGVHALPWEAQASPPLVGTNARSTSNPPGADSAGRPACPPACLPHSASWFAVWSIDPLDLLTVKPASHPLCMVCVWCGRVFAVRAVRVSIDAWLADRSSVRVWAWEMRSPAQVSCSPLSFCVRH